MRTPGWTGCVVVASTSMRSSCSTQYCSVSSSKSSMPAMIGCTRPSSVTDGAAFHMRGPYLVRLRGDHQVVEVEPPDAAGPVGDGDHVGARHEANRDGCVSPGVPAPGDRQWNLLRSSAVHRHRSATGSGRAVRTSRVAKVERDAADHG